MHVLEKSLGINISRKKEQEKHPIFYENVYGAYTQQKATKIDEKRNSLMVMDIILAFFLFTKLLNPHDIY